jgi:hypothetical protein
LCLGAHLKRSKGDVQAIDKRAEIGDIDVAVFINVRRLFATDLGQRDIQTVDQRRQVGNIGTAAWIAVDIATASDTTRGVAEGAGASDTVACVRTARHIAFELSGDDAGTVRQTATSSRRRLHTSSRGARRSQGEADTADCRAISRRGLNTTTTVRQTAGASLTDRFARSGKTWDIISLVDTTVGYTVGLRDDNTATSRQTTSASNRLAGVRGTRSTVALPCAMLQFAYLGRDYYALAVREAAGAL